ncbi:hypothetical protein FOL47_010204 [Perkinsus chesapeaki]|uniref:Uncharacterized protein n=1 Tax=Perkinsus chesapeaki TaxID=330153 RepID=A0A7J6L3E4_PERCH|nr:hypothetical protein FOL47_010204 [Perkinsus chesapeaki]
MADDNPVLARNVPPWTSPPTSPREPSRDSPPTPSRPTLWRGGAARESSWEVSPPHLAQPCRPRRRLLANLKKTKLQEAATLLTADKHGVTPCTVSVAGHASGTKRLPEAASKL